MRKLKKIGYLKLLLLLLFSMVFATSSTCYARTTLTDDEAQYVWEYLMGDEYQNDIDNFGTFNLYSTGSGVHSRTINHDYNAFKTYFNANNTIDINTDTTAFIIRRNDSTNYVMWVVNFNNGKYRNGTTFFKFEFQ